MEIDTNILNVVLGVVANGLTALIAGSYNRMKGLTEDEEETAIKESLSVQIKKAIEHVSDTIPWSEPPKVEEVCLFITSPEVSAVVRQVYATRLFTDQRRTLEEIREEFHRLFAYQFNLEYDKSKGKADALFTSITEAVEKSFEIAVKRGVLPAHEAKSTIRFRILHDELLALRRNVEFLTSRRIDLDAINQFEKRYREQISDRHGRITPPNFDDARKLPIDTIYVVPNFRGSKVDESHMATSLFAKGVNKTLAETYATFLDETDTSILSVPSKRMTYIINTLNHTPHLELEPHHIVMPKFYTKAMKAEMWFGTDMLIGLSDLLPRVYRTVILGNPGGGKSTLTNKICFDFTKTSKEAQSSTNKITPIPVILREYGSEKKTHNYSILQFIEATASDKYQLSPPPGAIEFLLLNGRAAVIFDGLDELLETGYRQEIRDDIESFCNRYPSVPVIITSREVGYEQAPLNTDKFDTYKLAPFNNEQVSEYVEKWFNTRTEYTIARRQQKSRDFLQESQMVSDLRANPLMLGLMCNIYRGENYIPKNRPDVYRKCAEMLFERWDRSREIPVTFHFEDDIRPAMAFLAHWIYADASLQEGVTERNLIEKAANYLLEHRYENRDRAERAAREFIEFCRGRAWVFTEAGTDKEGEGLYQFTHRTFLEYFAAVYLVRTHETTEELVQTLLPRIRKREWDIVAQLAFQIKSRSSEGAKDKLLSALLVVENDLSNKYTWNLLSFAARCLEFMEPSPKVTRGITTTFVEKCLTLNTAVSNKTSKSKGSGKTAYFNLHEEIFRALVSASEQNRETIAASFKESISNCIGTCSHADALTVLEIGLHLDWPIEVKAEVDERKREAKQYWKDVSSAITNKNNERIVEIASSNFALSRDTYELGLYPIEKFINRFGLESLFKQTRLKVFRSIRQEPIAINLLRKYISVSCSPNNDQSSAKVLEDVRTIGEFTISKGHPCIHIRKHEVVLPTEDILNADNYPHYVREANPLVDADVLFGIFILFAIWLEQYYLEILSGFQKKTTYRRKRTQYEGNKQAAAVEALNRRLKEGGMVSLGDIFGQINESRLTFLQHLKVILLSRFTTLDKAKVDDAINNYDFNAEQARYIRRWVRREFNLVEFIG